MVSLKDISEATGLSISVVSRALNPKPDSNARVAPKTQERVEEAAQKLGFMRNRSAEFLKRGKSATLGVFIPNSPNRLVADLMFGISEAASEEGFPVRFHTGLSKKNYLEFLKEARAQSSSGMLTYPFFSLSREILEGIASFRKDGGQVLLLNSHASEADIPHISHDDEGGAILAAEHLIDSGCQNFLVDANYERRTRPFLQHLKAKGIENVSSYQHPDLPEKLKELPGPVGIFSTSDLNALDVIAKLRSRGIEVGRDKKVRVIGYDNLYGMDHIDPPLTTIHQPFYEQGREAIKKLVAMIYGKQQDNQWITPKLITRESA